VALPSINAEIRRRQAARAPVQAADNILRLLLAVRRKWEDSEGAAQ
jgi:hypothetical protein